MKLRCTDGTVIDCDDFKAVESGVVLLDEAADRAVGFVPTARVEYVLPDELVGEEARRGETEEAAGGEARRGETEEAAGEGVPLGEPGLAAPMAVEREGGGSDRGAAGETDRGTSGERDREAAGGVGRRGEERPAGGAAGGGASTDPTAIQSVGLGLLREQVEALQARLELLERRREAGESDRSEADEAARGEAVEATRDDSGEAARGEAGEATDGSRAAREPSADEPELAGHVDGLGPTYARRLSQAGIESLADLAAADPEHVADAAETGRSRAADWVEQAKRAS